MKETGRMLTSKVTQTYVKEILWERKIPKLVHEQNDWVKVLPGKVKINKYQTSMYVK